MPHMRLWNLYHFPVTSIASLILSHNSISLPYLNLTLKYLILYKFKYCTIWCYFNHYTPTAQPNIHILQDSRPLRKGNKLSNNLEIYSYHHFTNSKGKNIHTMLYQFYKNQSYLRILFVPTQ